MIFLEIFNFSLLNYEFYLLNKPNFIFWSIWFVSQKDYILSIYLSIYPSNFIFINEQELADDWKAF